MVLVTEFHLLIYPFPKEEVSGLTSQIRKSSISISSNITEGFGRDGKKEL